MNKQVKLLSFLALFAVTGSTNVANAHVCDAKKIMPYECLKSLPKHTNKLMCLGAAITLGNIAANADEVRTSRKDIDFSVEEQEMTDILRACAGGTGITFMKSLYDKSDLDIKEGVEKSALNAAALWLVEKVSRCETYRSLDRNHWALKGWLPFTTKFDEMAKKVILFSVTRGMLNEAYDKAMTASK